jgi:predicted esterase
LSGAGPHQGQPLAAAGRPVAEAAGAMVMVHGRGATADSILTLADEFGRDDFAYLAPQAAGHSWYPYSFMAPIPQNEPGLSSGLARIGEVVAGLEAAGVPAERIVLLGFSQGACLTSEFAARNPRRYGGLIALSGGLIGPPATPRDYPGSLAGTPAFLGCSDRDPHIPLARVQETTVVLREMGAAVTERIYPAMGHTVNADEIEHVRRLMAAIKADITG